EYPNKKQSLTELSQLWSKEEKEQLKIIFSRIETLFKVYQNDIMDALSTTEAYDDPNIYLLARLPYEDSEISIKTIYKNLTLLISNKQKFAESVKDEMFESLDFLKRFVQLLGITLV